MSKTMVPCGVIGVGDDFDLGGNGGCDGAIFEGFRTDVEATLLIILDSPSHGEMESLSGHKYAKLLLGDGGVAFLMFKTSCLEFDLSINTKLINDDVLNTYADFGECRLLVNMIVVDSATSKVVQLGAFTLPLAVTKQLPSIIEHQAGLTADQIDRAINVHLDLISVAQLMEVSGMNEDLQSCLVGS